MQDCSGLLTNISASPCVSSHRQCHPTIIYALSGIELHWSLPLSHSYDLSHDLMPWSFHLLEGHHSY